MGGIADVIRTNASGNIYQFRMWISNEKRYVRQSLKTNDLHAAIEIAKKKAFTNIGIIESGKKVFGPNIENIIEMYIKDRNKDVDHHYITKERLVVIRTHLKHFISFVGSNIPITSLDNQSCYDYAIWRNSNSQKSISNDTIKGEKATINAFIKYANKKKYINFDSFEYRKVGISQNHKNRRDVFSINEYDNIKLFLRSWVSKKNNKDDYIRNKREMIREMFFLASNTLLRIGELMNLKWGDIQGYEEGKDNIGRNITLVTIRVRSETSKVRKERIITVRGGEYFKRWYEESNHKNINDYIFHNDDGTDKVKKSDIYEYWKEIMEGVGIDYKNRNLTWYSCRHFGITQRLKAGANIFNLAKIAGTSISQIETHYGHFDQSMSRATSMLNYKEDKTGPIYRE